MNIGIKKYTCKNAYKPGDIIGSMAGKTIEVLNTDVKGRLTLVDAVTYIIEKENVSEVVDLKNLGGKYAGTITVGLFIGEFVQDKPWVHIDIAGTA